MSVASGASSRGHEPAPVRVRPVAAGDLTHVWEMVRGLAGPTRLGEMGLPRLADTPRIEIELLNSPNPPGGVGELAVPPVAPAIANALYAGTGKRYRTLPLVRR